ncbi:Aste57867_11843 [Aphanomyces stellatus]|uniref:glucan endo-1,3-beta-D-glucosidase n=1 Tax=Aphanomyces stellatus TaxID=120398 RepID=A0A485KUH6_9STRA|nr:hypothetical protein As57867_011798 [Aphanomyces stellatus]VFT88698.1 Aste57867_11843 [Aphanomyces stellatus]
MTSFLCAVLPRTTSVHKLVVILVLLVCLAQTVHSTGVCYDAYDYANIDKHFAIIKQRFNAVRTYQTFLGSTSNNAVAAAAKAGLPLTAGIWTRHGSAFMTNDIAALVQGMKAHPNTVQAIYVGNEELANGVPQATVIGNINTVRAAVRAAGFSTPVGTVSTDANAIAFPSVAAACDIVGVNIYAFFGSDFASFGPHPIQDMDTRWRKIVHLYGDKAHLTETGWPSGGSNNGPHVSSMDNAKMYFAAFVQWDGNNGGGNPFYFMFHDNPKKGEYEAAFGLATADAKWKFDGPAGMTAVTTTMGPPTKTTTTLPSTTRTPPTTASAAIGPNGTLSGKSSTGVDVDATSNGDYSSGSGSGGAQSTIVADNSTPEPLVLGVIDNAVPSTFTVVAAIHEAGTSAAADPSSSSLTGTHEGLVVGMSLVGTLVVCAVAVVARHRRENTLRTEEEQRQASMASSVAMLTQKDCRSIVVL